jgi:hypothetical protein
MASPNAVKTLRSLLHELRLLSPNGCIKDSLASKYILAQFQKYKTTDEQLCKAKSEMQFMGNTYLSYLQSLRKQNEIQSYYNGRGDRTVAETANIVGFKLPHDPK